MYDQAYNDARYRRRQASRVRLYHAFAQERGECADHVQNFGERLLYSENLRALFQWDHRFGVKSFALSVSEFSRALEKLRLEIAKCAFVCANCHSLATQRNWHSYAQPNGRKDHSAT